MSRNGSAYRVYFIINLESECYYFMNYHLLTLFPNILDSYISESIIGRAIDSKIISVNKYNIRDYSTDKHKKVDGRAYGGGPGMVMWVDPIIRCLDKVKLDIEKRISKENIKQEKKYQKDIIKNPPSRFGKKPKEVKSKVLVVNFSPGGQEFTNDKAKKVSSAYTDIVFICGRYEGVDSRVVDILKAEEWSIGNYVLTGGELAAAVCIDSVSRQIPGVLGKEESLEENRISSHKIYGRPEVYEHKTFVLDRKSKTLKSKIKKYKVPEVLLSGHHKNIEKWKKGEL
ncbi:MAG: tRNA (guanine37-N1)-methyltransferase [Patescibacteria group bacterium]|nr:tRNA (guanine37-N1)-methyltransferase [Patescibacteria group bacterium]